MKDRKNILLTNLPRDHVIWLKKEASEKGLTVTGFVKYWIQTNLDNEQRK